MLKPVHATPDLSNFSQHGRVGLSHSEASVGEKYILVALRRLG